jgi:multidrug resistance efflux pump
MNRTVSIALLLAAGCWGCSDDREARAEADSAGSSVFVSAPGRVEGASETTEIGSAMDGVIREVLVEEGDRVEAGAVLATLECGDLEAAFGAARAGHRRSVESRRRVVRGAREEERRVAEAEVAAAEAALERARQRHGRLERLVREGELIARDEFDEAVRDLAVAEAGLAAAQEVERLVEAGPLPEEVARADAEVAEAEARVREASERAAKCAIAAPFAGQVLRVHRRPGEQVSLAFPRAVVSLADVSRLRVRAEIDERDLGSVREGQRVRVTADALGERALEGRVASVGRIMGRKGIRTGDPAEKSDRDVLEVVVDLEQADPVLVVGLRVTVEFVEP